MKTTAPAAVAVVALVALFVPACAGSTAEPPTAGDSCAVERPDFGGPATAADRDLFAYDVNAPLNLQKTVENTIDGVEVSRISFDSPGGGSATGMLFDPVTRSSLRPGIVLMHGLPGTARGMSAYAQVGGQPNTPAMLVDVVTRRVTANSNVVTWCQLRARTPGRPHRAAGKRPQRFLASTSVFASSLCELAGRFLPCDG